MTTMNPNQHAVLLRTGTTVGIDASTPCAAAGAVWASCSLQRARHARLFGIGMRKTKARARDLSAGGHPQ